METQIPRGTQALNSQQVCAKFSRKKSWLWDRLKSDSSFPRPLYLSPNAPVWIEAELDAYLITLAESTRKVAGGAV